MHNNKQGTSHLFQLPKQTHAAYGQAAASLDEDYAAHQQDVLRNGVDLNRLRDVLQRVDESDFTLPIVQLNLDPFQEKFSAFNDAGKLYARTIMSTQNGIIPMLNRIYVAKTYSRDAAMKLLHDTQRTCIDRASELIAYARDLNETVGSNIMQMRELYFHTKDLEALVATHQVALVERADDVVVIPADDPILRTISKEKQELEAQYVEHNRIYESNRALTAIDRCRSLAENLKKQIYAQGVMHMRIDQILGTAQKYKDKVEVESATLGLASDVFSVCNDLGERVLEFSKINNLRVDQVIAQMQAAEYRAQRNASSLSQDHSGKRMGRVVNTMDRNANAHLNAVADRLENIYGIRLKK